MGAPQPYGVVPSYHHHQAELTYRHNLVWNPQQMTQKYSHNPTKVKTQEILLKAFQIPETFLATSRCVYFKAFFPGLIPTCDYPKYSQKFLLYHKKMWKGWLKLDRNAQNETTSLFSALLVQWLELQITLRLKPWAQTATSDKLVLSANCGWGAGEVTVGFH